MSIAATIRNAKALDLAGARPGTSTIVHRAVRTLEDEHALRMNLQREASAARHIISDMEEDARHARLDAQHYADVPMLATALNHRADALERFAKQLRKALSAGGAE